MLANLTMRHHIVFNMHRVSTIFQFLARFKVEFLQHVAATHQRIICWFTEKASGAFLSHRGTPKSFIYNRIFPYKPSSYWGTPMAMETPIYSSWFPEPKRVSPPKSQKHLCVATQEPLSSKTCRSSCGVRRPRRPRRAVTGMTRQFLDLADSLFRMSKAAISRSFIQISGYPGTWNWTV